MLDVSVLTGRDWLTISGRGDDECALCVFTPVDISGGGYFRYRMRFNIFEESSVSLSYKNYYSGDQDQAIHLTFSLALLP